MNLYIPSMLKQAGAAITASLAANELIKPSIADRLNTVIADRQAVMDSLDNLRINAAEEDEPGAAADELAAAKARIAALSEQIEDLQPAVRKEAQRKAAFDAKVRAAEHVAKIDNLEKRLDERTKAAERLSKATEQFVNAVNEFEAAHVAVFIAVPKSKDFPKLEQGSIVNWQVHLGYFQNEMFRLGGKGTIGAKPSHFMNIDNPGAEEPLVNKIKDNARNMLRQLRASPEPAVAQPSHDMDSLATGA